jgi:ferredoxin
MVHKDKTVYSDECHACLQCIDVCPVKDTLYLSAARRKYKVSRKVYAWSIVVIFIAGTTMARIFGIWDNSISDEELKYHIQNINGAEYQHNQGEVSKYDREKWQPEDEDNTKIDEDERSDG